MKYFVEKDHNGNWLVIDSDGYTVSNHPHYETKREALESAKIREYDDVKAHERELIAAHKAGVAYWERNKPHEATQAGLEFHARTCGWHGELNGAWIAGFLGAKRREQSGGI
ncbi:MAG TPA: hypothetical protein VF077_07355 [Nitrospiraceae bacterium]